jgi:hypothetical protein
MNFLDAHALDQVYAKDGELQFNNYEIKGFDTIQKVRWKVCRSGGQELTIPLVL